MPLKQQEDWIEAWGVAECPMMRFIKFIFVEFIFPEDNIFYRQELAPWIFQVARGS